MDPGIGNLITGLMAGLGIGSVITALMQHSLKRKEVAFESQRKDLEARYRVVILLMYAAFDFETNKPTYRINRQDLKTKESVLEELKAEWHNMILFASSETLHSLQSFITYPSDSNLLKAAYAMRQDLCRGRVTIEKVV